MPKCLLCGGQAAVRQSFTRNLYCSKCFVMQFELEVHQHIQKYNLIPQKSIVAVGVSGGKDSSTLLTVLYNIFKQYPECYDGVQLKMVAVDEGIKGYRKESLEVVKQLQNIFQLDLQIVSFEKRFGRDLDALVKELHSDVEDTSLACSYCGILRRNCMTYGAALFSPNALLATGHNADDQAETVLLNLLRGDFAKLRRCTDQIVDLGVGNPKIKPFSMQAQKDIVLYAHHARVPYFSTECPYAVTAQRGVARRYIQQLSVQVPNAALNIINSVQEIQRNEKQPEIHVCEHCGGPLVGTMCQACMIKSAENAEQLRKVLKTKGKF